MTVPGYPVFGTHSKYYGGAVHNLPLLEKNHFLPDLKSIPADILAKAKVLVLNYPNNPTGASATAGFFAEGVEFAKKNRIIVIHDFAYAALVFEASRSASWPRRVRWKSASNSTRRARIFNMTGWRCGFVAGNELLVKAYSDVKDNTDSGQFLAIQHASAYAFDHPQITSAIAVNIRAGWTCWSRRCARSDSRRRNRRAPSSSTWPRETGPGGGWQIGRFSHGGGVQPVDDHRKPDLDRAVGRRGRLRAFQRHLRGQGQRGRKTGGRGNQPPAGAIHSNGKPP